MNPAEEPEVDRIKRLNPDVDSVYPGTSITLQFFQGNGSGIHFQSNFGTRKNFERSAGSFNNPVDGFFIEHRWCAAADIEGVEHQVDAAIQAHLSGQGIQKGRMKRCIGYGIKITVGAFFKAKRDVDV